MTPSRVHLLLEGVHTSISKATYQYLLVISTAVRAPVLPPSGSAHDNVLLFYKDYYSFRSVSVLYYAGTNGEDVDKLFKKFKKENKSSSQRSTKEKKSQSYLKYARLCSDENWVCIFYIK